MTFQNLYRFDEMNAVKNNKKTSSKKLPAGR